MAPKPGLHKQVSSIFEGVKVPDGIASGPFAQPQGQPAAAAQTPAQTPTAAPDATRPASATPGAANSGTGTHVPNLPTAPAAPAGGTAKSPVGRPKPAEPAKAKPAPQTQPVRKPAAPQSLGGRIKAAWQGKNRDPEAARQKKMMFLVGVLAVVFLGVLVFSLKGPSKAAAKPASPDKADASEVTPPRGEIAWKRPQPWPDDLRDPMQMKAPAPAPQGDSTPQADTSKFIVRGIVQGAERNSAIVSNEIVMEGEEILGARVIKINPDSVEFEMNSQRWVQPFEQ